MQRDLTKGNIIRALVLFSLPMIAGNLLQQIYNLVDAWIVGKYLGSDALAAVGSAYTLMTFLNSIIIGLCMGSGAATSYYFGQKKLQEMKQHTRLSFWFIGIVTLIINILVFAELHEILRFLNTPVELYEMMESYVFYSFCGLIFTFLYNFFAYTLRAKGNSFVPLCVLGIAAVLNIVLDFWFVIELQMSVEGAAIATVIAQAFSGIAMMVYSWRVEGICFLPEGHCSRKGADTVDASKNAFGEVVRLCLASCLQQSVMNFGILLIQGLVNSFGTAVMAAFAAAVKIDTLAYMPAQEFGNAYSLFISQNYGAGEKVRVLKGTKAAVFISTGFCIFISILVVCLSEPLLMVFIERSSQEILVIGKDYLLIEGSFYFGIGILFLLYGYYRGIHKPEMSLVLTVISLGTRVVLAYTLAPVAGVWGIWAAIPIGWVLADVTGFAYMVYLNHRHR